jgi:hypothetical protein
MNNHDNSKGREIRDKVLSNLIKIDMTRSAISSMGSSNSINKTNLANLVYAKAVKTNKEK